jgi:hypothetical protein
VKNSPAVSQNTVEAQAVHPLKKSYTIVSTKHVDYENLQAFEAISMTAVFVMAITAGVLLPLTMNV